MLLGFALFVPVLLVEDGLRKAGMDVSKDGMTKNGEGKSIKQVWDEAGK
jgi:hypothetical protein